MEYITGTHTQTGWYKQDTLSQRCRGSLQTACGPKPCFLFFGFVAFSSSLFSVSSTVYCRLNSNAKSSFCHTWQFEHTLFKMGLKQGSDFPHCQKILPWDIRCCGTLLNLISKVFPAVLMDKHITIYYLFPPAGILLILIQYTNLQVRVRVILLSFFLLFSVTYEAL